MKIAFYSPYLNILGGGERYLLSMAEILSKHHDVYIFADNEIKRIAKDFFNIDLKRINLLDKNLPAESNVLQKYLYFQRFQSFFYMTDGSIFFSGSGNNFLIIQSPSHIPKINLLGRLKLFNWKFICYSDFIREIIRKKTGIESIILSPSIDTDILKSKISEKKNVILTVGRFFPFPHNKKHDLLIRLFINNYKTHFQGWKLVIAGGLSEGGGQEILRNLKKESIGYPIDIETNLTYPKLVKLYKEARIYWHATGFGEDIIKYPEKAEHFGITTLEAMGAGCVPVVYGAGGQNDIISDGRNGYLWKNEDEFIQINHNLIENENELKKISGQARIRSKDFSITNFYENIEKLISE